MWYQINAFTQVTTPDRRVKPEILIFTGQSHKAIAGHADLSTASLQQQVVKAKLLRSSDTTSEIPGTDPVGKTRK